MIVKDPNNPNGPFVDDYVRTDIRPHVLSDAALSRIIEAINPREAKMSARVRACSRVALHRELEAAASVYEAWSSDMKTARKTIEHLHANFKSTPSQLEQFGASGGRVTPVLGTIIMAANPDMSLDDLLALIESYQKLGTVIANTVAAAEKARAIREELFGQRASPKGRPPNLPMQQLLMRIGVAWANLSGELVHLSVDNATGQPGGPAFRFFRTILAEMACGYELHPETKHLSPPLQMKDAALAQSMRRFAIQLTGNGQKAAKKTDLSIL